MTAVVGVLLMSAPPTDPLGPVGQDADDVRDTACRIVTQDSAACTPVTTTPRPPSGDTSSGTSIDFAGWVLWVLLAAVVVALLVLLVRWRSTGGSHARKAELDDDGADDDVVEQRVVSVDRSKEPGDWRAEADEHRRAGRFRDAVRCRYRALVGDLARGGVIDEIPGRTTGEHRQQMHEVRPSVSARFDEAAEMFDSAWYGHVDMDAAADDRFTTLARDVLAAAEVRR